MRGGRAKKHLGSRGTRECEADGLARLLLWARYLDTTGRRLPRAPPPDKPASLAPC
jgi:hypothetical protein